MKKNPKQYALATCTREATTAGIEIASSGGNAVDVAVASAFDLLVSAVIMCSIGGGGFALVKTPDGKIELIDFFDCMPGKGIDLNKYRKNAKPDKVLLKCGTDYEVMVGHATVTVPGAVKGLELLLKRHGTMPLKELLQPAIRDAKNGTKFNRNLNDFISISAKEVHWRSNYIKNILSTPEGEVPGIGYRVKQPELSKTLELIAEYGSDVVYKGDIADSIIKEIQDNGGLVTYEDLKTYEPTIRKPLETIYKGKKIWTNPLPSVGGVTLVQILNAISHMKIGNKLSPEDVAIIGKIQRKALFDKFNKYIDPEKNEEISRELLSSEYALNCYKKILSSPNTTHLSCIDDSGYAVSITMSMGYGSGVAIPDRGIFMSNSLGEIDLNPRGYLMAQPGEKLVSCMSPSLMYDESTNDLVVMGSASSSRISTSLMHVIMNMTDFNMSLHEAINSPRCHYENNEFSIETGLEVDDSLLDNETKICWFDTKERFFGGSHCVRYKEGKLLEAVNDPRRSGSAQTMLI
ncbi:MAG: gamma-glutamyltransferase [Cyanobacteriota bacterium]